MPNLSLYERALNETRSGKVKPLCIDEIIFEQSNTFLVRTKLPFLSHDLAQRFTRQELAEFRSGNYNPDLENFLLNPFREDGDLLERLRYDAPEYLLHESRFEPFLREPDRKRALEALVELVRRADVEPAVLRAMPVSYPVSGSLPNSYCASDGYAQCFDFSFEARRKQQEKDQEALESELARGKHTAAPAIEEPLPKAPRFAYMQLAAKLFESHKFSLQELEDSLLAHESYLFLLSLLQYASHLATESYTLFLNPVVLISRFLIRESMKERLSTTPKLIFSDEFIQHHYRILDRLAHRVINEVETMSEIDMLTSDRPWFAVQVCFELAYHSLVDDKIDQALLIISDRLARLERVYNRAKDLPTLPFTYMCDLTLDDIYNMVVILSPMDKVRQIENDPKLKKMAFSSFCRESTQSLAALQNSLPFLCDRIHDPKFVKNMEMVKLAEVTSWRLGKVELALGFAAFSIMDAVDTSVAAMTRRQSSQFNDYFSNLALTLPELSTSEHAKVSAQVNSFVKACQSRCAQLMKGQKLASKVERQNKLYGQWFAELALDVNDPLFAKIIVRADGTLTPYLRQSFLLEEQSLSIGEKELALIDESKRDLWITKLVNGVLLPKNSARPAGSLLQHSQDFEVRFHDPSRSENATYFEEIFRELPSEMHQLSGMALYLAVKDNQFVDARQHCLMQGQWLGSLGTKGRGLTVAPPPVPPSAPGGDSTDLRKQVVGTLLEQSKLVEFIVQIMPRIEANLSKLSRNESGLPDASDEAKSKQAWAEIVQDLEAGFQGVEQLAIAPGSLPLVAIPPGICLSWNTWLRLCCSVWAQGWRLGLHLVLNGWNESFRLKTSFYQQLADRGASSNSMLVDLFYSLPMETGQDDNWTLMPNFYVHMLPLINQLFLKSDEMGVNLKSLFERDDRAHAPAESQGNIALLTDQLLSTVVDIVALIATPAGSLKSLEHRANSLHRLVAQAGLGELSLLLWSSLVVIVQTLLQNALQQAVSLKELVIVEPFVGTVEKSMQRLLGSTTVPVARDANSSRSLFLRSKLPTPALSCLLRLCHSMLNLSHQQLYGLPSYDIASKASLQVSLAKGTETATASKSNFLPTNAKVVGEYSSAASPTAISQYRPAWTTFAVRVFLLRLDTLLPGSSTAEHAKVCVKALHAYIFMVKLMTNFFTNWDIIGNDRESDAKVGELFHFLTGWITTFTQSLRSIFFDVGDERFQQLTLVLPLVLSQFLSSKFENKSLLFDRCRYAVQFLWENEQANEILGDLFKNALAFDDFMRGRTTSGDLKDAWRLLESGDVRVAPEKNGSLLSTVDLSKLTSEVLRGKRVKLVRFPWAILYEYLWDTVALNICYGQLLAFQVPEGVLTAVQSHVKVQRPNHSSLLKTSFFRNALGVLGELLLKF